MTIAADDTLVSERTIHRPDGEEIELQIHYDRLMKTFWYQLVSSGHTVTSGGYPPLSFPVDGLNGVRFIYQDAAKEIDRTWWDAERTLMSRFGEPIELAKEPGMLLWDGHRQQMLMYSVTNSVYRGVFTWTQDQGFPDRLLLLDLLSCDTEEFEAVKNTFKEPQ